MPLLISHVNMVPKEVCRFTAYIHPTAHQHFSVQWMFQELKSTLIKPHPRKPNLDANQLNNYRPVSNLHFIHKIVEKIVHVVRMIEEDMGNPDLHDPLQSAYQVCHSTETAVMTIHNDIVSSLDFSVYST